MTLPTVAGVLGVRFDTTDPTQSDVRPPELPSWAKTRLLGVTHVMKRWPNDTCLRRSLVMAQRLRPLDPVLRIGVRRDAGLLKAHAWVEVGGTSLDGGADDFLPLAVRPGA
jgi:hypothetical protein